jgi:hypothetical protein
LAGAIPAGFNLYFKAGDSKISVNCRTRFSESVDIEIGPETSATAQAAFGAITSWAAEARSFWLTLWHKFRYAPRIVLYVGFLVLLFAWLPSTPDNNSANVDAAHAILDHGVDATNERQALALILALELHYNPHPITPQPKIKHLRLYVFVSILVLIVWSLPPGTVVGLWAGKHVLVAVKWWSKAVWVTTPLALIGVFVTPWIQNYFSNR